ncbi:MAG: 4Fe-4S dicluster domain-containing protein [Coriobacteriales bacterium]|nr:4Fe-4S dicluster domain-containing protein [Coriobacteriales bacterium]
MTRYGFAINLHRCIGCRTCTISCKMENNVAEGVQRIRVLNNQDELFYDMPEGEYPNLSFEWRPTPCQHCDAPPCVAACPHGATWKREDGIVVVDKEICDGCGSCIAACPYGARQMDEAKGKVDKCSLCTHRLDEGVAATMCQLCCPNRAILTGDVDDPSSAIAQVIAEYAAEANDAGFSTGSNVYYYNSVRRA